MLMRPTRVAAVICHALSPELSHDAYGFTASFPWLASPEGGPHNAVVRVSRVAQAGRPPRCLSRTPPVSHSRVSDTFPGCYAVRAVLLPARMMISPMFRPVRYLAGMATGYPARTQVDQPETKVTFR